MAEGFHSPRAIAFAMLGADDLLDRDPDHRGAHAIVERGAAFLSELWQSARRPDWAWFESGLAYDNARLAEALLRGGRRLSPLPYTETGLRAWGWLCGSPPTPGG